MVVELFVKNEMPVTVVCLANNKYGNIYISKVMYRACSTQSIPEVYIGGLKPGVTERFGPAALT